MEKETSRPDSKNIHYKIKFTNKDPVPIDDLITSLKSYEKIIKRTAPFIEKSFPDTNIVDIQVYVANLESGSLIEDYLVKIFFKSKEDYEQAKEIVSRSMDKNTVSGLIGIGVGALITYGVMNALTPNSPSSNIEAYNGAIVQLGGTMNITEKGIKEILDGITDKKSLAREAIGAIAPAKREKDASIEVDGQPELKITKEFISEAPIEYEPPLPISIEERYENVDVEIMASDQDSHKKSWAGAVPGIAEKRVNFELHESVDPNSVHGKRKIKADILVTSARPTSSKEYKPKLVFIERVR